MSYEDYLRIEQEAAINPTLLIEVLSPSTEAYDRGQKAAHYRQIASLREYVLVSQDAARLEVFRRAEGGRWIFVEAGVGESLTLESVGCTLVIDELYAGRIQPPAEPAQNQRWPRARDPR